METVPNKKTRRSKRQVGLEVSPAVSLTQKKKQKPGPAVNTADKDGDKTAENEKGKFVVSEIACKKVSFHTCCSKYI